MTTKGRILMAMSGGLDSSVSAILLKEQGYEVIGITMKLWNYPQYCKTATACCDINAINDARQLAVKLNIPHYVIDYTTEFKNIVIQNFIDEYLHARTPNPCVMCNIHLKWNALMLKAKELNCDGIATGHYAIINQDNGRFYISKAKDPNKDQSYVLWGLSQDNLSKTIFPLGNYSKSEIRDIAKDMGFHKIANKRESYDICFIPDNDYRTFLIENVENIHQKCPTGNFLDTQGNIVGQHKGFPFYTIGQRKGLQLAFGTPRYVCSIDANKNTITLGEKQDLLQDKFIIKQVNFGKYASIPENFSGETKIRYRDAGQIAHIEQQKNHLEVHFNTPVAAITPGQSAVIYENNDIVAGGIIHLKQPNNL